MINLFGSVAGREGAQAATYTKNRSSSARSRQRWKLLTRPDPPSTMDSIIEDNGRHPVLLDACRNHDRICISNR